ncbi:MAG: helix-turn-helix domain-containing protein [Pseudomonadota bacterium]
MNSTPLPSLAIPTIPGVFVWQLLDAAGLSRPPAVEGLEAILKRDKLSIAEYVRLVAALNARCDDEMIGMLARSVPLGSFAVLCSMLAHSSTIETALENYARFYALFTTGNRPLILIDAAARRFTITVNSELPRSDRPYFAYSTLLGAVKLLSWLSGQRLTPQALEFGFEPFGMDSEFTYLFGTAPAYGSRTRAEFAPEVSQYPVAPQLPAAEFSRHRTSYLLLWGIDESFVRQLYALIAERLQQGRVSSDGLADELHMSRQTLARRLQEAGTSYSEVLLRVRKDKAIGLLRSTRRPLLHVAEALGYNDTRSFSRAFKRWTGSTPGEYRKELVRRSVT